MKIHPQFMPINRRQLLRFLGVGVVFAAPTLAYALRPFKMQQADQSQTAQSTKKIVVSF